MVLVLKIRPKQHKEIGRWLTSIRLGRGHLWNRINEPCLMMNEIEWYTVECIAKQGLNI